MHQQSNQPRRWRRLALASTFVGLALVGGLASATPAAAAAPHTPLTMTTGPAAVIVPNDAGPRCGTGGSSGNVNTCITAFGSGLHVNEIDVSAQVLSSARDLQICLRGPAGVIACNPPTGFIHVGVGGAIGIVWTPNATEPGGDYCANTWRKNASGPPTQIGHECINVHA